VTVTEYAVEDGIEKNDLNKSCRGHEGLSFGDLNFELDFEVDLGRFSQLKQDRLKTRPAEARSVTDSVS